MTRFKHLTYQDLVKYQKIQLTYEKLISFSASKISEKREVGKIRGWETSLQQACSLFRIKISQ